MSKSPDFDPSKRALFGLLKPKSPAGELTDSSSSLAERIGNHQTTRRKVMAGAIATTAGVLITSELVDVPKLFNELLFRAEFSDVWDELQAFLNPETDEQLMQMVYNPNGKLSYTPNQLENLLILGNGDSMNLAFGIRKNRLGPDQPNSWLVQFADNLGKGAKSIGIHANIFTANYAQPGAAKGLVRYEYPEGNVQLGAKTVADMSPDKPGETPPIQAMIDFDGQVDATVGMNGDHLRGAMDTFIGYYTNDEEFRNFCEHASEDKLTSHVKDVLKDVLHTYKKNIDQFKTDFEQALAIYEQVNTIRVKQLGKLPLRLICTLPINYKYASNVPYVPLSEDSKRTSGGKISLTHFPNARAAAQRLTTSYYQTINPLLEDFHKRTGIEVHTLPMLDISKDQSLFGPDGHYTDKGQAKVGNRASEKSQLVTRDGSILLTFNADGSYLAT